MYFSSSSQCHFLLFGSIFFDTFMSFDFPFKTRTHVQYTRVHVALLVWQSHTRFSVISARQNAWISHLRPPTQHKNEPAACIPMMNHTHTHTRTCKHAHTQRNEKAKMARCYIWLLCHLHSPKQCPACSAVTGNESELHEKWNGK